MVNGWEHHVAGPKYVFPLCSLPYSRVLTPPKWPVKEASINWLLGDSSDLMEFAEEAFLTQHQEKDGLQLISKSQLGKSAYLGKI